ncbi:ABC transporter related [Gluconacetobacter diazotrophicus PA1 5]|nr:sugar ABC transporter ATP-binding protein [Gluconacetobacter diazotrophicus]ACI50479.1 ABC transporter related [Gluconacetobacter diazotrophicus PA1 5]TWA98273.1 monosaccharide ABC transporter ATP-binding protein (CUT2 family) [Gluconacetobacter diazotrophicus]
MTTPLLQLVGIEKHFGGVHALRGVDFTLLAGEVHVLLGENGAGKSTLMGVVSGATRPDDGRFLLNGEPVHFHTPRDAQAAGIVMIPQELDLVPGLDIAANLFLGHEPVTGMHTLAHARMRRDARALLARAGVDLDPALRMSSLRMGERQLVSIAKALGAEARVLILDEPTAALSAGEAEHLFATIRELRGRGVGIIYISHRLEEVPQIADRVTVMRDGAVVGEAAPDAPQATLVHMLVGRDFKDLFPPRATQVGPPLLRLDHARFVPTVPRAGWQAPQDVSLCVHAGEIVGLSGRTGAGRTELLSALYGFEARGTWEGTVEIAGRAARLGSVARARRAGLAYVTDDRRGAGLMLGQSVGRNVVMSTLARVTPWGMAAPVRERMVVKGAIDRFDIRPRRPDAKVVNLSGGNQQKIVFAKELLTTPKILLLDEPTRGVDVGAKSDIYFQLRALTAQGLGVLVASSELPELIGLCDRIVVMNHGVTVADFAADTGEDALRGAALEGGVAA